MFSEAYDYDIEVDANWEDAQQACTNKGMRLAVLNTQERLESAVDFLYSVMYVNISLASYNY